MPSCAQMSTWVQCAGLKSKTWKRLWLSVVLIVVSHVLGCFWMGQPLTTRTMLAYRLIRNLMLKGNKSKIALIVVNVEQRNSKITPKNLLKPTRKVIIMVGSSNNNNNFHHRWKLVVIIHCNNSNSCNCKDVNVHVYALGSFTMMIGTLIIKILSLTMKTMPLKSCIEITLEYSIIKFQMQSRMAIKSLNLINFRKKMVICILSLAYVVTLKIFI